MSNLIKLVVVLVVVILGVIFRKRIHARSKKMYGWTARFVKKVKVVERFSHLKEKLKKKEEEKPAAPPEPPKQEVLLTEIRDLMKSKQ